jgi:hypothetical protein
VSCEGREEGEGKQAQLSFAPFAAFARLSGCGSTALRLCGLLACPEIFAELRRALRRFL